MITVLLFYAIPVQAQVEGFEAGILLFIIIATSLIMTLAMVWDKRRTGQAVQKAKGLPVGYVNWEAPMVDAVEEKK